MIRPLTKRRKKDRGLYLRPPEIEAEIHVVLTQDPVTRRRRLLETSPASPDFLKTETLVYLIRDAFRRGDDGLRDAILTVLLTRCEAILNSKISGRLPNAESIREEIQSDFTHMLAQEAAGATIEALDYYECRFMGAFRTLRLTKVDKVLREINRSVELPQEANQVEVDTAAIIGRSDLSPIASVFHEADSPESAACREQVRDALNKLPEKEAAAFILVRILGYDEESDNPSNETAATRLNCTGRTVRTRLRRAEEKLSKILSKEHP